MKRVKFMNVLCVAVVTVFFMTGFVLAEDDSWQGGTGYGGGPVTTPDNAEIEGSLKVGAANGPLEMDSSVSWPSVSNAYISRDPLKLSITTAQSFGFFQFEDTRKPAPIFMMDTTNDDLFCNGNVTVKNGFDINLDGGGNITSNSDLNITSDGDICIGNCN